jgi:hypothetical protein
MAGTARPFHLRRFGVVRLTPFRFGKSQAGKRQKPAPLTFPVPTIQVSDQLLVRQGA